MNEIYLIGLGNPGKNYSNSRHNVGFLLLENLSKKYNSNFLLKDKLKSACSEFRLNNSIYRLFLPNTFMNNSGDAVQAIIDWYKINLDQIFVIVDDKDLPLGRVRFRKKGSSGGHNGLKSIIEKLQTHHFNRIRIGIGSPPLIKGTNKFKKHDLIGVPYQIIIGTKSDKDSFEFKELNSKSEILSLDKIIKKLKN